MKMVQRPRDAYLEPSTRSCFPGYLNKWESFRLLERDRLVIREQEIVLIEYKTHARATADNIVLLARNFAEQMRQYGSGALRLWPQKKLRLLLLFTACGETVEITP